MRRPDVDPDDLATHRNLTRVVLDIEQFREDYNHTWPLESLDKKTPAELYYCANDYVPKGREIVTPYVKDDEIRLKFTNRFGGPARMAKPLFTRQASINNLSMNSH